MSLLDRLNRFFRPWSIKLDEDERAEVARDITRINLTRMRIMAWLSIFVHGGVTAFMAGFPEDVIRAPGAEPLVPWLMVVRLVLILGSMGFLVLLRLLGPADEIGRRHRVCVSLTLVVYLTGVALLSGLALPVHGVISAYLMALFITAAFIYQTARMSLFAYGLPWLVLSSCILTIPSDLILVIPGMANATGMTILAFIVSRITFVAKARDIANQRLIERQRDELERLSLLDGLTGIYNRRYFDEAITREWKRAGRSKTPLSLIMIDIDHFKPFNDTYGHQAGDDCLIRVALALSRVLKRPGDLVARYGGEEFAVLLPGTNLENAELIAARMSDAVGDLGIPHSLSVTGRVTISLGVAFCSPNRRENSGRLIQVADEALYQAKDGGRNQYVSVEATVTASGA